MKNKFPLGLIVLTCLLIGFFAGQSQTRKSYMITLNSDTIIVSPHDSIPGLFVARWNGGGECLDSGVTLSSLFGDKILADKK